MLLHRLLLHVKSAGSGNSPDKSAILNLQLNKVLRHQDSPACLHALLKYTEDINCGHRNNCPHHNESPNHRKIAVVIDEF